MCHELRYVNDQIIKKAALLYLTLTMLLTKSQRQPHYCIWHSQCYWPNHKDSCITVSDTHNVTDQIIKTATLLYLTLTSHSETQNKMALPESKFSIRFSKNNVYFCVRIWEQKAGKCYMKSSFVICTAYWIVLVGEMKGNGMGGQCSTYSGYRNGRAM